MMQTTICIISGKGNALTSWLINIRYIYISWGLVLHSKMSYDTFWWSHDRTFSLQVNQNANAQFTGTMALDHHFMPNTNQDFLGLVPNTYTSNIYYFNPRTFTTTDNRYPV